MNPETIKFIRGMLEEEKRMREERLLESVHHGFPNRVSMGDRYHEVCTVMDDFDAWEDEQEDEE